MRHVNLSNSFDDDLMTTLVLMNSVEMGLCETRIRSQPHFGWVDTSPSPSITLAVKVWNRLLQESNHEFSIVDY